MRKGSDLAQINAVIEEQFERQSRVPADCFTALCLARASSSSLTSA